MRPHPPFGHLLPTGEGPPYGSTLPQLHTLRLPHKDPVEQQLERSVRLRTKQNLRAIQHQLALTDRRFHNRGRVLQISLPERPSTSQRLVAVEPGNRAHAALPRGIIHLERRTAIEEEVRAFTHAVRERI